ncbi:5-deoxy-glucuronate isomerase [Hahella sp. NBU794]|uniref:5-deoxy-glucuronate isomerase n=1 Tax=Hahella sp. NBU794 TaxID=3422590 RepID=UPI003D6E3E3C
MSHLLRKARREQQQRINVTPENASWKYVGFQALALQAGEIWEGEFADAECCLVLVAGKATVEAGADTFADIGERMSPFEKLPPYAVYVPPATRIRISAQTDLEVGLGLSSQVSGQYPVRLIKPDQVAMMNRGEGSNLRRIHNILMLDQPAERLLLTEVFTPSGNWSSYPPHKHDSDRLPEESYLEETYYHRINPAQGFVFQRVYNDDRSLDETMSVYDGDCVIVPEGYHPVGVPHGYESYYLNVMAGPVRDWKFHNDPDHEWILSSS